MEEWSGEARICAAAKARRRCRLGLQVGETLPACNIALCGAGSLFLTRGGNYAYTFFYGPTQSGKAKEALAAYANGEVARDLFTRITPLFLERLTVRSYEVKHRLSEQEVNKEFTLPITPFCEELSIAIRRLLF